MTGLRTRLQQALGPAYELERELGGGGMSRVYVARDTALRRRIVVKVLSPELASELSLDRFRREIMMSAALQHPHIVGVLGAGEVDGLPFFTMPYVEGESLRALIERGPLNAAHAVGILKDVARALAFAHARGIVHRDIKPDNVLLSGGSACVADFGVAKALSIALQDESRSATLQSGTLTRIGTTIGTPQYMAPEQAAADVIDHRVDIYAFGITAYEMLAGRPPFDGRSAKQLLAAQLTETPAPIATWRAGVPPALEALVMRCLQKEPADRPQTAVELIEALENPAVLSGDFMSVPPDARARSRASTIRPAGGRHVLVAGAAIVLAITAAAGGLLGRARQDGVATSRPAPAVVQSPNTVAVLPLVNLGSDSSDARIAGAIANQVTSTLARVPGLRIVSESATAAAFARAGDPRHAAQSLGAGMLVEGTVQREGRRVRVTARLVDASDGYMLWADAYDGSADDLFAIQDHIAEMVRVAIVEKRRG